MGKAKCVSGSPGPLCSLRSHRNSNTFWFVFVQTASPCFLCGHFSIFVLDMLDLFFLTHDGHVFKGLLHLEVCWLSWSTSFLAGVLSQPIAPTRFVLANSARRRYVFVWATSQLLVSPAFVSVMFLLFEKHKGNTKGGWLKGPGRSAFSWMRVPGTTSSNATFRPATMP